MARAGEVRDWAQLTKPGLNALVLFSTLIGFYLASGRPVAFGRAGWTLLGTGLTAAGAAALNQFLERVSDGRMRRTAGRPLPTGRLRPGQALAWGLGLSMAGVGVLVGGVNGLTGALAALSLVVYLGLYTPMKRVHALATLIGAVSGALPPVLGWTGATGRLEGFAVLLFLILYLWQVPHFLAIAWKYREDYAAAGLPVLSVGDPNGRTTGRQAVIYAMALWPVSLMPTVLGHAGLGYGAAAGVLGLLYVLASLTFARRPSLGRARLLFVASVVYLPLLLIAMVMDKAL